MSPQQTIAHYRITSKLGEGGMGEVWRATDTKLGREVAIKVLPDAFAADPDRLARFTREAQVLASLNHPNIAAIYGVEERALVMELVPGPTLAERIAAGPMALEEALPLVSQLIDALEYAHERGVVHRDLKPANIKITPEGKVKVLDFGLAKALTTEAAPADPTSSPTLTMRSTLMGTIMGTAAYMAPEQARGQNVDKRADIWAFGVVVYEMLTGSPLFEGQTVSDTLASVLTREPECGRVPAGAQRLVRACLEKDARRRLRDIGDARRLLEDAPAPVVAPAGASRRPLPWMIAAVLGVAALAASWVAWRGARPVDRPLIHLDVDLGPDAVAAPRTTAVLSPDGRRIVFPVRNAQGTVQLATRTMDQPNATNLSGTEYATDPFFSPDGQWIGFFSGGKLKKISVQGGAAAVLCDAPAARGASWGSDGSIILSPTLNSGLQRVPDAGGTPQPLTDPAQRGEASHRWPQILPGGQAVLFTSTNVVAVYEDAKIQALSLKTGRITQVGSGGYFGRYLPSGHLVYIHQGTLFAVPFDAGSLRVRGAPVPIQDGIASNPLFGAGQFDFSRDGMLLYAGGKGQSKPSISLIDAAGSAKPLPVAGTVFLTPRFSPDGKRLAFEFGSGGPNELWVYDFQREAATQLTFGARVATSPVWTPDGKHIALAASGPKGGYDIWWVRSDGAGEPQVILDGKTALVNPSSFSPDGKRLIYSQSLPQRSSDISILPIDTTDPDHPKAGPPEPFLRSAASEIEAEFSPDGRWVAYASDETGGYEVYVRPYHPGEAASAVRWRISASGGRAPQWSRDGRQLYYRAGDNRMMVADCAPRGEKFDFSKARPWADRQFVDQLGLTTRQHDLSPDGKHFAVVEFSGAPNSQGPLRVTVLLNFFDELKRRVP